MKDYFNASLFMLVCLFITFSKGQLTTSNRSPCQGVPDGRFVQDLYSCDGWYQCWNGEAKHGKCRDGYAFERRTGSCNYKEKVDCENCCPCKGKKDGTFVNNPVSCKAYFVCIAEYPNAATCPDGFNFDPDNFQCVNQDDFQCTDTGIEYMNIACQGLPDYSFVENEKVCGEFLVCTYERGRPGKCPGDFLYNPRKGICDYKDIVNCPEVTPPPEPEKNMCTGVENGKFLKDPDSCEGYFQCIDEKPRARSCDNGLWFNPTNEMCDDPKNVDCTPPKRNPCEGKERGEFFEDPQQCNVYLQCINERVIYGACPDNLLFNPLYKSCDYKENVICGTRRFMTPTL